MAYYAFRLIVFIFRFIPFWGIYFISNGISFLLYRVIKYRYKVIKNNLKIAFPKKSNKELEPIIKGSYLNLSDILVESLKGMSCRPEDVIKRYKLLHTQELEEDYKKGRSVISTCAHFANWEWGALVGGLLSSYYIFLFYKPIKNARIEAFLQKRRNGANSSLASIQETRNIFHNHQDQIKMYFLIGDQSPSNIKDAIWLNFFNQDTACLHGIEKYAKKYDLPVYFFEMRRVRRGYYELHCKKIIDQPNETPPTYITSKYMECVETAIRNRPTDWLWSHRRWKHKR